jgi:hypothetical protein
MAHFVLFMFKLGTNRILLSGVMPRSPDKLLSLLLMLLLAFSPLQGVMAGADVQLGVETGQPGMTHSETGGMSMHDAQRMSADCQHCDEQSGCNQHDCSHTHCASCVPGLLSFFQQTATTVGSDSYPVMEPILSSRFTSHPFRPPKA